jgi:hypothetical protein
MSSREALVHPRSRCLQGFDLLRVLGSHIPAVHQIPLERLQVKVNPGKVWQL